MKKVYPNVRRGENFRIGDDVSVGAHSIIEHYVVINTITDLPY